MFWPSDVSEVSDIYFKDVAPRMFVSVVKNRDKGYYNSFAMDLVIS